MKFLNLMKNMMNKINIERNMLFSIPVSKQKEFIGNFNEPRDDFERSYFQYRCQCFFLPRYIILIRNSVCFFLMPIFTLILLLKNNPVSASALPKGSAVFITGGLSKDLIPNELSNKFTEITSIRINSLMKLNFKDITFLLAIFKRFPFSFYFLFKNMLKISMYRYCMDLGVKTIISSAEYSFTSSILTLYCEKRNIEHLNIMHGEKLFYMRDSFFRFSRFYVWDEYYVKLFSELRAEILQFKVAVPDVLKPKINTDSTRKTKNYYLTYYLGGETNNQLKAIAEVLNIFQSGGKNCAVRVHPVDSNVKMVQQLFVNHDIENSVEVLLKDSFNRTDYIVSLYSTVLYQAYNCNKKIVLDDYCKRDEYDKLSELKYVMIERPHFLLSELISQQRIYGS